MPRSVRRLLVVLAVAGAGFVPAPADAAYCSGSGVNVVVDYGSIKDGIERSCGSGSSAQDVFRNAGIALTPDQQYSSVVCKVEGLPTNANCAIMPPANAYWGLYWSDGTSGHWVYSTVSVDALKVPSGGFVAFAWQSSSSQRAPGATPLNAQPQPSPTPTKKATSSPTKKPATGTTSAPRAGAPAASASASGSPSATPTGSPTGTPSPSVTADAGASPSSEVSPPAVASGAGSTVLARTEDDGGGLPWWVPVAVLVGLAGGGGAAWWTRRRRTT
jgi:hypothetical protein